MRCLLLGLRQAKHMIADRGYDGDWLITVLKGQGVTPCIPPRKNPKKQRSYSKHSTNNATRSRSCLAGPRIGAGLPCGTIAVPTLLFQPFVPPQPSSFISKNES
ncbi:MAG: transposase [Nitrospira sp.]|nr:MAG: transposase [Nitrospira sp.]